MQARLTYLNDTYIHSEEDDVAGDGYFHIMEECCNVLLKAKSEEALLRGLRVLDPVIRQIVEHMINNKRE